MKSASKVAVNQEPVFQGEEEEEVVEEEEEAEAARRGTEAPDHWLFSRGPYSRERLVELAHAWYERPTPALGRRDPAGSSRTRPSRHTVSCSALDARYEARAKRRWQGGVPPLRPLHWAWVAGEARGGVGLRPRRGAKRWRAHLTDDKGCLFIFPFPTTEVELEVALAAASAPSHHPRLGAGAISILEGHRPFALWVCTPTAPGWRAARNKAGRGAGGLQGQSGGGWDEAPRDTSEWLEVPYSDMVTVLRLRFTMDHPDLRLTMAGMHLATGMEVALAHEDLHPCPGSRRTAVVVVRFLRWLYGTTMQGEEW